MYFPKITTAHKYRLLEVITEYANKHDIDINSDLSYQDLREIFPVDYDMFEHYMSLARDYCYYTRSLNENYGIELFSYPSAMAAEELTHAMEIIMFDTSNKYISYYMHELNFGELWSPGRVVDENGNDIRLECIRDLWNLLLSNVKNELIHYNNNLKIS